MTAWDTARFALRALRGHRLRTGLSILGVAIGVASVIMLTSLGEGARLYVTGEFSSLGSTLIIVLPGKSETTGGLPVFGRAPNDLTIEDARAVLERIPNVRLVAPIAIASMQARSGETKRDCMIVGTTHELARIRRYELSAGRFLPEGDLERDVRVCVIGAAVKKDLFGARNALGELVDVGGSRFRVIGVLAAGGTGIGGNVDESVYLPVSSVLRMLNRRGLFRVLVEINSFEQIGSASERIVDLLAERHGGVEDVTIFTQDAMLATFNRILSILTLALAGIAAISLTVAGVGIMNVMLVSVSERTREVGLLKSLGATRFQISAVFLAEASLLSLLGGLAGLGIGLAAGALLRHLYPAFPAHPPDWAVAAAIAVSVGVGILFGSIPARRAARLDPITALSRR